MNFFPKLIQPYIGPLLLLVVANLLLLTAPPLSYAAALLLLAFLPGWVWLQCFFDQPFGDGVEPSCGGPAKASTPSRAFFDRPGDFIERLTLAIGLSLALTIFSMLLAVYLPGRLTATQLLVIINAIIILGLAAAWWRGAGLSSGSASWASLGPVLLLLLLAGLLRLPRLGYAEFHEDEAEAMMLGVRLLQGEDYAIFLHRKGPAQMLLPVAFWQLSGAIDERLARFPFTLSSLLSVITLFFIGRRWFNPQAGLAAGLLWAVNGYAIGFGRMVQYQALIFFLGPLGLYCLYLAWKNNQLRWQLLGAIFLATCLLAHFDALLLLPAAAYLIWQINAASGASRVEPLGGGPAKASTPARVGGVEPSGEGPAKASTPAPAVMEPIVASGASGVEPSGGGPAKASTPSPAYGRIITGVLPVALFLMLLASFYLPYMLDPEFQNTTTYLAGTRVKPGLLYNNLDILRRFDRDYSSHFYLPALAVGLLAYAGWPVKQKQRWLLIGLLGLLASTFWLPAYWQFGDLSLALIPWLLAGLLYFRAASGIERKTAWLSFGAALIGYVFLVSDPRTHLYILYPGAALLAGAGWAALSAWPAGRYLAPGLGFALLAAIILYDGLIFLQTESGFTNLRRRWDGSGWELIYNDLPQSREYFGYPKKEGWKAIGALRAQGLFPGDFRSVNEDFIIPIWYNYGQARSCYETPAHFFVRPAGAAAAVPAGGPPYSETAQISREGELRLQIFSIGQAAPPAPALHPVEQFERQFDRLATPERFAQQADPDHPVGTQFGTAIHFTGYDLPTAVVTAGETLYLNLYWQALQAPQERYRAFAHLTDGATLWAQQDDDPACRLPTSVWRPGQRGVGQFRLPLNPDTPPGRYPLIIGLYQADTLERLKITQGAGTMGDDFLWLGDIEVVSPSQVKFQ